MATAEMKNRDNVGENVFSGIFGFAVYETVIIFEIQNGGFKMVAAEMKNRDNFGENMNFGGFRVSWVG